MLASPEPPAPISDDTIKLRDAASGRLLRAIKGRSRPLRTFEGHRREVSRVLTGRRTQRVGE